MQSIDTEQGLLDALVSGELKRKVADRLESIEKAGCQAIEASTIDTYSIY